MAWLDVSGTATVNVAKFLNRPTVLPGCCRLERTLFDVKKEQREAEYVVEKSKPLNIGVSDINGLFSADTCVKNNPLSGFAGFCPCESIRMQAGNRENPSDKGSHETSWSSDIL